MSDDLEERVRALELQVARLRAAIAGPKFGSPALRPAGRLLWAEGAGYVVWGAVAAVFAVPFAARAVGWTPPWPDAYETIGHLPTPFKLLVAFVVAVYAQSERDSPAPVGQVGTARRRLGRFYVVMVLAAVAAASIVTASGAGTWARAYVIYGVTACTVIFIPNALAFLFASDVPFPTLTRTIAHLRVRVPVLGWLAALILGVIRRP